MEGQANDSPPDYDSAVRGESIPNWISIEPSVILDPESLRVQLEASAHRVYFKVMKCFSHPLLKNKLVIAGTNLERITMTVSIFTIVIVILQVVAEVLRVTSIDHKVTLKSDLIDITTCFSVHCFQWDHSRLVQPASGNFVCQWFRLLLDNALIFHSNLWRANTRSTTWNKYWWAICVNDRHILRLEFYYVDRKLVSSSDVSSQFTSFIILIINQNDSTGNGWLCLVYWHAMVQSSISVKANVWLYCLLSWDHHGHPSRPGHWCRCFGAGWRLHYNVELCWQVQRYNVAGATTTSAIGKYKRSGFGGRQVSLVS